MDPDILQIDNDREWIQWWIEDEEWEQFSEQWDRQHLPKFNLPASTGITNNE